MKENKFFKQNKKPSFQFPCEMKTFYLAITLLHVVNISHIDEGKTHVALQ